MPTRANINREVLKWARKTAKISLEKAASTISKTCKVERIKDWESPEGVEWPSVKQVEKLARLYRRPVDVFYLKYIPKDFPLLKDFRSNKEAELSTAVIFMMREIQEKQEWMSKFLAGKREKKIEFVGKYTIKSLADVVAKDIRKTLNIQPGKADLKPLKHWIEQAESRRIFVTLSSNFHTRLKLDSDTFKGFAIADKFAPFIFINADDWEHGQLFSLVHGLAHIWIGVSGISNDTGISLQEPQGLHVVEKFCRAVAEEAILPEADVRSFLEVKGELTLRHIAKAGRRLGVSNQAFLVRARRLQLINEDKFSILHKEADQVWKEFLIRESRKPKSSGGPNYYVMQLRRSSRTFSTLVMDIYKSGKVSGADASRLLSVKEGNFGKYEKYIYK
ncbi:MAG TPA: ImmA/IrrE family metallo-endopeptidase [Bacteroidia bacterium]|nr:ImmA/IrrE family metallo-endopeptidase [Bacteroidia bacterium]